MNEEKIISTLQKFGKDFQIKCISTLLTDKSFIERISDIIDPTFFESESHQWIVKEIIEYFIDFKELPTPDSFRVKLEKIENKDYYNVVAKELNLVFQKTLSKDLAFIREQFLQFCINQKMKNAIVSSLPLLENGEYEKIRHSIELAMKAGMERNVGHDYMNDIDVRMSVMARNAIKTNWVEIDTVMDGGLAKGELGIIVAPAGIGKSWLLARIGAEAMRQGKNVLHITLELNENYAGLRYDACFTGIDFQNIRNNVDIVKKNIAEIKGKLIIKYFPIKTISPNTIKIHAERLKMLGISIDMIVVDYADILRPANVNKNDNSYQEAGSIYEELRAVAGELQIPIWSASQANRSATDENIVTAGHAADSYRKIMTADFIMSLSRRTADKVSNTARIHIIKNRFGPDGMTFPTRMNAGSGDIRVYADNSPEGVRILNEMSKEENEVKKLKDKWTSHNRNNETDSSD